MSILIGLPGAGSQRRFGTLGDLAPTFDPNDYNIYGGSGNAPPWYDPTLDPVYVSGGGNPDEFPTYTPPVFPGTSPVRQTAILPPSQSGGLAKTIENIVAEVSQAFGKRPLYSTTQPARTAGTTAGSYVGADGITYSSKGVAQDVGNTVGKFTDVLSSQTARLLQAHPLPFFAIGGLVVFELIQRLRTKGPGARR